MNLQAKCDIPFCISVDFNARTGNLPDFVSLEEGANDFDLCHIRGSMHLNGSMYHLSSLASTCMKISTATTQTPAE